VGPTHVPISHLPLTRAPPHMRPPRTPPTSSHAPAPFPPSSLPPRGAATSAHPRAEPELATPTSPLPARLRRPTPSPRPAPRSLPAAARVRHALDLRPAYRGKERQDLPATAGTPAAGTPRPEQGAAGSGCPRTAARRSPLSGARSGWIWVPAAAGD
jgi:hypothetical protein